MKQKIYQIDAFTTDVFKGNPAAVCPLDEWISDELMQSIAAENNLAETAFYVKRNHFYELRWFTPATEVDLCGHATLASAFVLFNFEGETSNKIQFYSPRSGDLFVEKKGDLLELDFPKDHQVKIDPPSNLFESLGAPGLECYKGKTDYMVVYESEEEVRLLNPNFFELGKIDARGIIVTAPGNHVDFVSRFFGPQVGIDEDPVTGSAHTTLTPYWAEKLEKSKLSAMQLSKRTGELQCELKGDRVKIAGHGKAYLIGEIITA